MTQPPAKPPLSRSPATTPGTHLPPATRHPLTPVLLGIIALALIPALILAFSRVAFEGQQKTVAMIMDYPSVSGQANVNGQTPLDLLNHYRTLGVNGVAVYEDTVSSRVTRGELYLKSGADLASDNPGQGFNTQWTYTRDLKPGTIESLIPRYNVKPVQVKLLGFNWFAWPINPAFLPAGPNLTLINSLKAQGYIVVYRPFDSSAVLNPGADWPDVPFLAFTSGKITGEGNPDLMRQMRERLGKRVPAIIESTTQKGLEQLIAGGSAVRLFSISSNWQNTLTPTDVSSKFVLAARERSHKLLYMRPFRTIEDTDTFLTDVKSGLGRWGISVGLPKPAAYEPSTLLRWLCVLGPLAALLLVGVSYPLVRVGLGVAVLALLGALGMNGFAPLPGFALIAAITFPALGLVLRRHKPTDWFVATGLSLAGVLFVSALGATRDSMLGLDPFKGVGLTLAAPILLVALSFLPRQDIRRTLYMLFARPIRLGDVLIVMVALLAVALVFLRRGNSTGLGVSDAEAQLRQTVQDNLIRPRFKEVAGHPLLLLGLSGVVPGYVTPLLLLGGVIGQGSILNTFTHFHTPLLISFTRAVYGLGLGLILGYILIYIVKWVIQLWNGRGEWLPQEAA
ncbi:DUF5693 family protein [Deinococcus sp. KNUC1210]|uniref:DUF5693 family protein n=1 Tax=Deinococcus sp. KNUC1210 TaxID=2917691 RepID=UPI001EEFA27F|nr:DUF5693 family protein [Deinococcus sp. KNUC1210]ULH16501.1 DUF5693 family protein [Deinococcus sp. KNUC1210]